MSFKGDVKTKVLVACRRKCVLCGKFCGTKIELHHIKQQSDGGPDTFDNCIPLCFNCHADVRTYNPGHPKGTKYTEEELRIRRDIFYKEVEEGKQKCISPEIAEKYEVIIELLGMLLRVDKNTIGAIEGYTALQFSYQSVKESFADRVGNDFEELVVWLQNNGYVQTEIKRGSSGIEGTIKITRDGASYYIQNT